MAKKGSNAEARRERVRHMSVDRRERERDTRVMLMAGLCSPQHITNAIVDLYDLGLTLDVKPMVTDCIFCQADQHHVQHTEQHAKDGIVTQSMYNRARELNARLLRKGKGSTTWTPTAFLRAYIKRSIIDERRHAAGRKPTTWVD